jgi:hypothetical protein
MPEAIFLRWLRVKDAGTQKLFPFSSFEGSSGY